MEDLTEDEDMHGACKYDSEANAYVMEDLIY